LVSRETMRDRTVETPALTVGHVLPFVYRWIT
jgi:hypothetical protein